MDNNSLEHFCSYNQEKRTFLSESTKPRYMLCLKSENKSKNLWTSQSTGLLINKTGALKPTDNVDMFESHCFYEKILKILVLIMA